MIRYEDFGRAAFDNDSRADEGHGLAEILRSLNTSLADVRRAAEQRALRVILIERGPEEQQRMFDQAYSRKFSIENLSREEQERFVRYMSIWMDACATALKAAHDDIHHG